MRRDQGRATAVGVVNEQVSQRDHRRAAGSVDSVVERVAAVDLLAAPGLALPGLVVGSAELKGPMEDELDDVLRDRLGQAPGQRVRTGSDHDRAPERGHVTHDLEDQLGLDFGRLAQGVENGVKVRRMDFSRASEPARRSAWIRLGLLLEDARQLGWPRP